MARHNSPEPDETFLNSLFHWSKDQNLFINLQQYQVSVNVWYLSKAFILKLKLIESS